MAKGNKKNKKSKSKTATISDTTTATSVDPTDYYYGSSTFRFPNNDRYEGEFCAHRAGLVWREGSGVYTTHDGQIYEGEWKEDRLIESKPVKITFPNGSEYFGKLSNGKYNGPASYTLPNRFIINSHFSDNKPSKETVLIDVLDKLWCGYTKTSMDCTYLLPENEFYLNIDENRGKGVPKVKPQKAAAAIATEDQSITAEEVEEEQEKVIFAESTKTKRESNYFEDSLWYKRYKNFVNKHSIIKQKIKENGESSLDVDEGKWWLKYLKYKARRKMEKKRTKTKEPNLESKKLQENLPVVVFYPKKQPEPQTTVEEIQKADNEQTGGEEEEENYIQTLYEEVKREKDETEKRFRKNLSRQQESESNLYRKLLDETKNPNCSCRKHKCDCLLACNQNIK